MFCGLLYHTGGYPRSLEKPLNINNHTNELLYQDSLVVKLQFKTHKHHFVSKILSTKEMYKTKILFVEGYNYVLVLSPEDGRIDCRPCHLQCNVL